MSFVEILILAVVQGLTEFLPVSSSGHLVVANAVLDAMGKEPTKDLVEVSIVLHLGTLAAVLVYYRREILRLLGADRRVIPLLVLGTVPAAVIGIALKKVIPGGEEVLKNVLLAGLMFPVTAAVLWLAGRRQPGDREYQQLDWRRVLAIGFAQALALLPGISRSGSTIAAGLAVGLRREASSTFAFLLAIPAIAGAGVLEGLDVLEQGTTGTPIPVLTAGFAVSFAVGWAALALLIQFVKRGRLGLFAWYLVPLGVAVIVWQILG